MATNVAKFRGPKKRGFYTSSGRHYRRSGASVQGTLSNWIQSTVTSRIAEREKRKVSDRAWDLYINDAMGHGVIEGLVIQCVNIGLTPIPDPLSNQIGMSPEWATEYQTKAYNLFEIWGLDNRNFCDVQRRMNIYMLQALAYFQWKIAGVSVFQTVFKKTPFCPLSISFLPIDPARIVTPYDVSLKKDIYDGFELDKDGAVKAVYVSKPKIEAPTYVPRGSDCIRLEVENKKIGLPNVIVCCDVRNISEYKQDSILSCMIKEIKDNADFVDAALVKSLVSNLWTAFVTSEGEAIRQHELQTGGTADNPLPDWEDRIQEMDRGTIITGFPGETAHFMTSDAPGTGYDKMYDSILGRLGMASGRGPENISRQYRSSYSASRAAVEDAAKFDDYDRMILNNRFNGPVFSWVQYESAVRGLLPIRSIDHFRANLYSYTRTNWLPPPIRPIDHAKEAQADDARLKSFTKTYSDIYGERSADWRQKLKQVAIEQQFIKNLETEYGVSLSIGESTAAPTSSNDEGDD